MGSKGEVRGSGEEDDEDGGAACCSCDCRRRWQRSVKRKREAMDEADVGAARVEAVDEVAALREALASHQQTVAELYTELEEERAAAASATDEAMSMILRLQQEKAEAQMEARQFRRFVEEKMSHDQQELAALEDALFLRDQALQTLYGELQSLRRRSTNLPPLDPGGADAAADVYDHPAVCEYPALRCSEHQHQQDHDLDRFPEEHLENLEWRMERLERTEMEKGVVLAELPPAADCSWNYRPDDDGDRVCTVDAVHGEPSPSPSPPSPPSPPPPPPAAAEEGVIKKLYMRLEALEADRESMRQAIISMRTDKAQLVLLKEIAQNLCQDAFSPPPPSAPVGRKPSMRPSTQDCSSFMSMIQVIFELPSPNCRFPYCYQSNRCDFFLFLGKNVVDHDCYWSFKTSFVQLSDHLSSMLPDWISLFLFLKNV